MKRNGTTLKQALREYPGDVRTAANHVRDEWRKLTWPRLTLRKSTLPNQVAAAPEEAHARKRMHLLGIGSIVFSVAWIILTAVICYPLAKGSADYTPHTVQLLAIFCLISVGIVFDSVWLAMYAGMVAEYGEWTTAPQP